MPKFSSAKMLMYIISLLTGSYSVACGSAGACVHVCLCVCVCVCVCERERESCFFYQEGRRTVNVSSSTLLFIFISVICF